MKGYGFPDGSGALKRRAAILAERQAKQVAPPKKKGGRPKGSKNKPKGG